MHIVIWFQASLRPNEAERTLGAILTVHTHCASSPSNEFSSHKEKPTCQPIRSSSSNE